MQAYTMRRYTLVAPHDKNDGTPSGYQIAVAAALLAAGIDGWTEYQTIGSWRGKRERGTTFEIYRDARFDGDVARILGLIGRSCMPDQEAVQVTRDNNTTTLWEA